MNQDVCKHCGMVDVVHGTLASCVLALRQELERYEDRPPTFAELYNAQDRADDAEASLKRRNFLATGWKRAASGLRALKHVYRRMCEHMDRLYDDLDEAESIASLAMLEGLRAVKQERSKNRLLERWGGVEGARDVVSVLAEIDSLVPDSDPYYDTDERRETLNARRDTYVRLMYEAAGHCARLLEELQKVHREDT